MKTINFLKFTFVATAIFMMSCKDNTLNDLTTANQDTQARKGMDGVTVNTSSLPAAIIDYINANYAGKTIIKAEKYPTKYEVKLSDLTKLEFTLTGAFIEVSGVGGGSDDGNKIKTSDLPAAITTYISTKYPGVTITKIEKSASKIEVRLSNGLKLEFTLAGVFIEVSGSKG